MDAIDRQILEILQEDSSVSAREIADTLNLTTSPIYDRIKKLEELGIIQRYVALLDANLLGKNIIVFMNMTIKDHHKKERDSFIDYMSSLKEVSEFYHTSGTYDFLVKVRFANITEYRNFLVNEVTSISNISDIDSQIVLEEIKHSTKVVLQ